MPLTLITGVDEALCERAAFEAVLTAAQSGASPMLVAAGSTGLGWMERELAAVAPVGIQLLSASRFLTELWAVHGDGRPFAGVLASEIIMREAIADSDTSGFGAVAQAPGFARALLGISVRRRVSAESGRARAVAVGVSGILAEYRRRLHERGLISMSEAAENLTRDAPLLEGPLLVAGAEGLDADLRQLCVALAADNDVSFALTWDRNAPATRASDAFVEELLGADAVHRRVETPAPEGEIAQLVDAMRRGSRGVIATGAVQMRGAAGREAEAAMVAVSALAATRTGISADRIVVALPHLRAIDAVVRAMRSAGLEYGLRGSVPLFAIPFGRAFRTLLAGGCAAPELAITGNTRSEHGLPGVRDAAGLRSEDRLSALAAVLCAEPLDAKSLSSWGSFADELLVELVGGTHRDCGSDDALNSAAHQAITRLVGEAAAVPGVAVSDLLDAVGRRSAWVDTGGPGVLICDLKSMDAVAVDVAIVAGLSERDMPLRRDDGGVLRDTLTEANDPDLVRLRFHAIASQARDRLVLVRQESEADGAPARASQLWNEVLDAYQPMQEGEPPALPPLLRTTSADLEEYAPVLTLGRRADRRAAFGVSFGAASLDRIEGDSAAEVLRRERTYSASEVESYLRCPQRWFWEWVVRPRDADGTLDARELGLRAHGYLAEFYRRVGAETARGWEAGDREAHAAALLADVVESESATISPPASLPEKLDAARAVRWARDVIEQDIECVPWPVTEFVEMRFGVEDGFEFGGHRFRGRIDRIDRVGEAGLIVIDYKSSRDVPGFAQFERAGVVQAVIYAAAAERVLGQPIVASAYRSMTNGCVRGFWRTDLLGEVPQGMRESDGVAEAEAAGMRAQTEERVAGAISGMRAGAIGCIPATGGSCDYCPVRAVCGGAR